YFSSRRRHTRFSRDWSSDVCSSDLSKYAGVANYWTNRQGMIDALTAQKTADTKRKNEAKFNKRANKKKNKETYGNVIADINAYYAATNEKARHDNYLMTILRTSNLAAIPYSFGNALI